MTSRLRSRITGAIGFTFLVYLLLMLVLALQSPAAHAAGVAPVCFPKIQWPINAAWGAVPAEVENPTLPTESQLTDASGAVWTLCAVNCTIPGDSTHTTLVAYVNGVAAGDNYNSALVLLFGGQIYTKNTSAQWYEWNPTSKSWTYVSADPRVGATVTWNDTWASWTCATANGYETEGYLFNWENFAPYFWQYLTGLLTPAQALADCATSCTNTLTPTEQAFMDKVGIQAAPVAVVAFAGYNTTAPIYTTNPDGTLNTTAVANWTVTVGTSCNYMVQIPGTQYFAVPYNADGSAEPANSYALCTVTLPHGAN